ncbi:LPXTG-site transpeptidase (sortase) family protein [Saccharomonospora amisosensis]|uniref:LPXTG-site transpeptidase (Sortase) family protein n=1 Tax=Saccharomonospora amisosensis TaxID=1128677 RepID=A0A7X5ZQL7_9PSEU|nr:class F sortase [Saccharomonospora amisosensis]NIJ11978.1 LPXTG-site transpeptidase (sortase) family protein [Saccharomonospora amisosensis]
MTRRFTARAGATWLGLAMVVTAGTGWLNTGSGPTEPAGFADPSARGSAVSSPWTHGASGAPPEQGSPGKHDPARESVREVRLPERDVRIPVIAVGVAADGTMRVPEDVRVAGWYRFGPKPGDPRGSAVISGHINDRDQGRGVFGVLTEVTEGEPVVVTMADGSAVRYRVTARRLIDKGEADMPRLFERDGAPRLTLITCGGPLDRSTHDYRANIVVTAVPSS